MSEYTDSNIPYETLTKIADKLQGLAIEDRAPKYIEIGWPERRDHNDLPDSLWGYPIHYINYLAPWAFCLVMPEEDVHRVQKLPAPTESILAEAERITSNEGEQRRYYGSPSVNAGRTAQLWTAYVQGKYGVELELSASDVSVLMILLKVAREANAPKRDNRVDIAGWANVLDACEEGS